MRRLASIIPRKIWKLIGTLVSLGILVFALWLLRQALGQYQLADVFARLRETPWTAVALSLAASLGSYLALGGFDWLAIHYLRRRISVPLTFLASFISHAISHSAGFAALTGGAIRYRMYTAAGLTALEVAAVIVFCAFTFAVGAATLAALALTLAPDKFAALSGIAAGALQAIGIGTLLLVALYVVVGVFRTRPIRAFGRNFTFPGPRTAALQMLVAATDLGFAAMTLYVLLPEGAPPPWAFVGIYVLANLAGLVTHVPGGLGVFETAVVLMTPEVPADATLGALVLFRVTYNLVPLALGAVFMAAYEVVMGGRRLGRAGRQARVGLRELEPAALSVLVFAAGAMLLLTGATPDDPRRLAMSAASLPLAVPQGAHVVAAGAGAGLLLTARGISRRLSGAYRAALALLALGGAAALLRAFDYEETIAAGGLMLLLVAGRRIFYRLQPIAALGPSTSWLGAGAAVLIAVGWLTVVAFHRAGEPVALTAWTSVALDDGAARALRAGFAAVAVFAAVPVAMALARRPPPPRLPGPGERARAAAIILRRSPAADANRALLGDVALMFDAAGGAFIMYVVADDRWVALGEPVGPEAAWPDLAWNFREAAEAAGAKPVFLRVAHRPLYLDLGLGFSRIGELARVQLRRFALQAPARPALRRLHDDARRAGATFEILPAGQAGEALRRLGEADPDRLAPFPTAVARIGQTVVAAAPVWAGARGSGLALGGVRRSDDAPAGIEAFLTAEVMLWGKANRYRWFELGLAAGDQRDPLLRSLAELLARSDRGRGLADRRRLEDYAPEWHPVYAAVPAEAAIPALAEEIAGPAAARLASGLPR